MYNLSDIRSIHFEITSKCQARCPMCPRRIKGGPLRPGMVLDEVDLKTFITWFPKDFIQQLNNAPGNDYIILHDLSVWEYVWPSGASPTWIKTGGGGKWKKNILYYSSRSSGIAKKKRKDITEMFKNIKLTDNMDI